MFSQRTFLPTESSFSIDKTSVLQGELHKYLHPKAQAASLPSIASSSTVPQIHSTAYVHTPATPRLQIAVISRGNHHRLGVLLAH